MALDQRRDVRVVGTREEIPLPVARNRTVLDLGRALSDGDGIDDLAAPLTASAGLLGPPDDSLRSQMPDELLLEHASSLNEEASVDGFVGDLHLRVSRISPPQPP
jgi:hypothetical protein